MREEAQHAVDRAINDPSKETIEEAQRAIDQLPEDEAADRQFKDDLQSKLDAVRDHSQIHFKHTDETRKVAQMNLNPTVERLNDQKKTAGGVLGLDIGILELGLISAEQINKISDLNRHQVTVPEGHLLDGQVEVTVRSVLGGHAFKVHILKKQEDGQYKKVQTLEESSGSFLFMGKTAKVPFDTLDAGEYEFVLETGAGLTVVQVIPYHLTELQLSDYTNVSTKDARKCLKETIVRNRWPSRSNECQWSSDRREKDDPRKIRPIDDRTEWNVYVYTCIESETYRAS